MNLNQPKTLASSLGAILLCVTASVSRADTIGFDFNSLADSANNSSVQTYMQNILTAAGLGTVSVSGAVGEKNYNGDNHVVGNSFNGGGSYTSSGTVYSNTLGTSDGATAPSFAGSNQRAPVSGSIPLDTFLVNNTDVHSGTNSDRITMTFTLPTGFKIESVSFDYEIFPNASCDGSSCSAVPNFTFEADDVVKLSKNASEPVDPNDRSPDDGTNEDAWQFIGVSGLQVINDTNNVTKLEFIDWPEMIGIDNLVIHFKRPPGSSPQVPEPASMLLLGFGLLALKRKFFKAAV